MQQPGRPGDRARRIRATVGAAISLCLISGCQATFSEVVVDTTSKALSQCLTDGEGQKRVAAVTYTDDGRGAASRGVCDVAWEFVDRGVVQNPGCTNVSPELVRRVLSESGLQPRDLHARDERQRFLALLDEQQQRPDLLVLAKLSQQAAKTRGGFRNPRILLSIEVVDSTTGDRLAKENAWLDLQQYR